MKFSMLATTAVAFCLLATALSGQRTDTAAVRTAPPSNGTDCPWKCPTSKGSAGLTGVQFLALQQELRDRGCGNAHVTGSIDAPTRRAIAVCAERLGVANNAAAALAAMDIGFDELTAPLFRTAAWQLATSRAKVDLSASQLNEANLDNSGASVAHLSRFADETIRNDSAYRSALTWYRAARTSNAPAAASEAPPAPIVQHFAGQTLDAMLQGPMIYKMGRYTPYLIIIPRGFVTDYASIPKAFWVFLIPTGPYGNAAVVHDYLYWTHYCTKSQSDNIMAIGMLEANVPSDQFNKIVRALKSHWADDAWKQNEIDHSHGLLRTVGPPYDQVPATGTWQDYRAKLKALNAKAGIEYQVPPQVCAVGDSVKIPM